MKLMKMTQDRRSLEYMKLEVDLEAIQNSLIVISRELGDASEAVVRQRDLKPGLLKFLIEEGNQSPNLLRGLQLPDPEVDKVFGKDDIIRRLGLETADPLGPNGK
ncbi:hypothetical protein EYE42_05835 [Paracoccus subflavus]|uniref:Uncharacterized protein n=1 Tax=Paracoccus subflavus TaxID=2528244 RepID=A0A4Q9G7P7_9RHOB|nr:hypothetical protein [Paracoccus subflavus]TBN41920.1 hypothetical protein EYE42_05835 [Paracoccus subflavus]